VPTGKPGEVPFELRIYTTGDEINPYKKSLILFLVFSLTPVVIGI